MGDGWGGGSREIEVYFFLSVSLPLHSLPAEIWRVTTTTVGNTEGWSEERQKCDSQVPTLCWGEEKRREGWKETMKGKGDVRGGCYRRIWWPHNSILYISFCDSNKIGSLCLTETKTSFHIKTLDVFCMMWDHTQASNHIWPNIITVPLHAHTTAEQYVSHKTQVRSRSQVTLIDDLRVHSSGSVCVFNQVSRCIRHLFIDISTLRPVNGEHADSFLVDISDLQEVVHSSNDIISVLPWWKITNPVSFIWSTFWFSPVAVSTDQCCRP